MKRTSNYWLDLFSLETWEEASQHDFTVSGFRRSRWKTVQKIKPGNVLICYLIKASRFAGALKVISEPYVDETPIWTSDVFPCRLRVEPIITLEPKYGVPVKNLSDRLSFFRDMKSPISWMGHFRGSPAQMRQEDGDVILEALEQARTSPIEHPLPGYLARLIEREKRKGVEPTEERVHERLKSKIQEIGKILGKSTEQEHRSPPYTYDVVWREAEGLRPSHVFEVQHRGAVDQALAKLQHARDIWNPRLFLVVTGEKDRKKVDLLLRPFWEGAYHRISRHTSVLGPDVVEEIHHTLSTHSQVFRQFAAE